MLVTVLLLLAAYLIGAVPFGYLVGRLRGVDLFKSGSGNIGATNTGRVLGWRYGVLVFALDFLKGAVPVALIAPAAHALAPALDADDALRVGAALLAFLGHLFPVYLGFRGGKGVATGAGAVFVLVPVPALFALLTWVVVLLASRMVSLASMSAVTVLVLAQVLLTSEPFDPGHWLETLFCVVGSALVVVKHRGNVRRLLAGTENRIGDGRMRHTALKVIHLLALGLWFGGGAFFIFAGPTIFDSFKQVVADNPSDRTAYVTILPSGASAETKKALASALAGSAVGPIFPKYFLMQTICAGVALLTALAWWNAEPRGTNHRRVYLLGVALILVLIAWPISDVVSQLRLERYSPDKDAAKAAVATFWHWHLVSLFLSFVTTCLAGVALAMGAKLPSQSQSQSV
jgi:acyl-phosphate glycerol 3-phosphate acyltransferase